MVKERRPPVLTEEFIADFNRRVGRHLDGHTMLLPLRNWRDLSGGSVPPRYLFYMRSLESREKTAVSVAINEGMSVGFTSVNSLRGRSIEEIRDKIRWAERIVKMLHDGFEIPED